MNPLISVIVPCYNQAQYLDECLQSVLDQTYTDWECIIVNDGSSDHTEEVAKKWLKKDPRFKYIHKENGGLSSARNAGITQAKGEWVLPLDADDKIGNLYLELAEKEFSKNPTVIYCNAEFFGNMQKKWEMPRYDYGNLIYYNQIFCSAFFRKIDWQKVNGYDENMKFGREDWEFWMAILNEDSMVIRLEYLGFHYRRKEISMDVKINKNVEVLNNAENYIFKKHLNKYLSESPNAIKNTILINEKIKNYNLLLNLIHKNKLTKFLFKIIKFLN